MARSSNLLNLSVLLLCSLAVCYAGKLCTRSEIDEENMKKLATANNDLALNIHRRLTSGSSQNVFFSPLSLSTAFGMLYYGTKGETAKELRSVLGYETADLPDELVHQTFQRFLTESLPSTDRTAYVLNSANAILLDENLDVIPSYKREVQDLYQASVQDVDFSTQSSEVTDEVNAWVKEKTNGKIDKLLDKLDPSTVLVLLNAVYFKGTWKTQFEKSKTTPQKFYNNGLESEGKDVPMMHMTARFPYADEDDFKVVELPYKGENISMLVLLPNNRDGLESLEKSLTLDKLARIRQDLYRYKVYLTIPKFKIQYSKEMSGDFQDLGAKDVFTPGGDFSGITSDKYVFVSQVLHKAVVEVNEEGSEAAAVTGMIGNRIRPSFGDYTPTFTADHPFLFAIVDRRSDLILFLGRVMNL